MPKKTAKKVVSTVEAIYGQDVFNLKVMKECLSKKAFDSLSKTINESGVIDPAIVEEVANAMKDWAISKGATHFCHWFQPLTGSTAEKHDSFISPDGQGGVTMGFSAKELIQGEPDASSFPSGGLRATFEARGYTAWDPTSPAFIKQGEDGATLCIPTIFCGYHGEALDKKTPLLRSSAALAKQMERAGKLFRLKPVTKAYATLGPEQEYFLIDKSFYQQRLDLIQTGRTLFGRKPSRHQQMEDHYFGAIRPRVLAFMEDLDEALWKLGAPAKTRHNEVSPAQFEIAPIYERLNLAIDHNLMCMELMRQIADRHGLVCLLHEKPFAGVNGSGKHNNWSVVGVDGKNWLHPGANPHENAKFLFTLCAVIKAVDEHADLLRASVASPGNDHRLGANEAPPAIISIFLGDQLTDIVEQIEKGEPKSAKAGGMIQIGADVIPDLPRDATDRNRTSPFAFTGNKFEFRALGSNMNPAGANVVLNTIVAEALDQMCAQLEADMKAKKDFNKSLQSVLQAIIKKHKRVIFNGDNYTQEWHQEAERRGLPNKKTTPEALKAYETEENVRLFEKHAVLSKKELLSRYEIYMHNYKSVISYEAECARTIAATQILPAAFQYQMSLADAVKSFDAAGVSNKTAKASLVEVSALIDDLAAGVKAIDAAVEAHDSLKMKKAMLDARAAADALEGIVPADLWPLPTYAEMLFLY
ncbi:MAG: glutamine synthetase III [Candidatus Omnitrophica bacterium]|nr:glutamine synthetase III [Candidatus Omnitrophota bacterium]